MLVTLSMSPKGGLKPFSPHSLPILPPALSRERSAGWLCSPFSSFGGTATGAELSGRRLSSTASVSLSSSCSHLSVRGKCDGMRDLLAVNEQFGELRFHEKGLA